VDTNGDKVTDHTVGDVNDILMGTGKVTGANRAYRGLVNEKVRESNYAEIIWFVRGTTLYRQTKLIIGNNPTLLAEYPKEADGSIRPIQNFHEKNDVSISMRNVGTPNPEFFFNTLSSLARRENRFARYYVGTGDFPFPHNSKYRDLRLPTLAELDGGFLQPNVLPEPRVPLPVDLWNNPNYAASAVVNSNPSSSEQQRELAQDTGWLTAGSRAGEDIVLTNVISFDIKVWNPETNTFVNLGDGSIGAFGSGGRYSKGNSDYEKLVTLVNIDENFDNLGVHKISSGYPGEYFYTEDKKGEPLPVIQPDTPSQTQYEPSLPTSTLEIDSWKGVQMSCVFDTWTKYYESSNRKLPNDPSNLLLTNVIYNIVRFTPQEPNNNDTPPTDRWTYLSSNGTLANHAMRGVGMTISKYANKGERWESPPPYDEELRGIEITIRCFDPTSGNIRQVRIVKHLNR
jgi:hypothetical protein